MARHELAPIGEEERAAALRKASEARHARALLKQALKTGSASVSDVFASADAGDVVAGRMRVFDLVKTQPGYGPVRAAELMREIGISRAKRVRGASPRQREALIAALDK